MSCEPGQNQTRPEQTVVHMWLYIWLHLHHMHFLPTMQLHRPCGHHIWCVWHRFWIMAFSWSWILQRGTCCILEGCWKCSFFLAARNTRSVLRCIWTPWPTWTSRKRLHGGSLWITSIVTMRSLVKYRWACWVGQCLGITTSTNCSTSMTCTNWLHCTGVSAVKWRNRLATCTRKSIAIGPCRAMDPRSGGSGVICKALWDLSMTNPLHSMMAPRDHTNLLTMHKSIRSLCTSHRYCGRMTFPVTFSICCNIAGRSIVDHGCPSMRTYGLKVWTTTMEALTCSHMKWKIIVRGGNKDTK